MSVQKSLADPQKAVSDENIAAVFSLLCLEESLFLPQFSSRPELQPDLAVLLSHTKGLAEMVRLRGGIHGLSSSRFLQHLIIRYICFHDS